jgi:hypothetical protein
MALSFVTSAQLEVGSGQLGCSALGGWTLVDIEKVWVATDTVPGGAPLTVRSSTVFVVLMVVSVTHDPMQFVTR